MKIDTNYLEVRKTARYATYGTLSSSTKYFWFCLHGSNMICDQMLYKFREFDEKEHFIVAPEGLNTFYQDGFSGDVVANWMTKRDRKNEISDFSFYLKTLYDKYVNKLPKNCLKIGMGFSQGGTTLYRAMHRSQLQFDHVLGYSCWIPEDIDLKQSVTDLSSCSHIYTYGEQDQFLTQERIRAMREVIKNSELAMEFLVYNGDHRIDRTQLKVVFERFYKMK